MHASRRFGLVAALAVALASGLGLRERLRSASENLGVSLDLKLSPSAWQGLRDQPREKVRGSCVLGTGAEVPAEIHLKGTSSFEPIDHYPSFTVKLLEPSQPLPGKFHLNNSAQDKSFCRDIVARHLYRRVGVPVPEATHAFVTLNTTNRPRPYVLAAAVNQAFLEAAFPDCDGDLFEGETSGCHPRRWSGHSTPAPFGEPSVDWFLSSRDHAGNFEKFIAAEYLVSHTDGYLTARNNYWVYRCTKHSECFMFPHTLDNTFHSSYWVLTQPVQGKAAVALLKVPEHRSRIKQLLKQHSGEDAVREILALLRTNKTTLLGGDRGYNPVPICTRIEVMERQTLQHFANLMFAFRAEEGKIFFTDDFRRPERWFDASREQIVATNVVPRLEGPPLPGTQRYLQCHVMIRPGSYRWLQPISVERPGLADEISLEVVGPGCSVKKRTATQGASHRTVMAVDFTVSSSTDARLFELELARFRVTALSSNVHAAIRLSEGDLQRIEP
jgi:hypothetical protein